MPFEMTLQIMSKKKAKFAFNSRENIVPDAYHRPDIFLHLLLNLSMMEEAFTMIINKQPQTDDQKLVPQVGLSEITSIL